jgi:hypothetical protein
MRRAAASFGDGKRQRLEGQLPALFEAALADLDRREEQTRGASPSGGGPTPGR